MVVVVAFSTLVRILGERSTIDSPPALKMFFLYWSWDWFAHTNSTPHARGSVHSGLASWDDCGQMFPDKLRVSSFPDRFPHYALTEAYFVWVKGVCVFRCNLPPALLAEWPGSFIRNCSNMGIEQTLNKSEHTKLILEKKILPPLLPRFRLATFWSRVWQTYQQAILAPHIDGMCNCGLWRLFT